MSGALDQVSHRVANLLVGNAASAATLEVTLAGPELRIEEETRIAITGADLAPTIDGAATLVGTAVTCRSGSVLRFGERSVGARAYVAFDGGIDTTPVFGSRATHIGSALGGLDGRPLVAGRSITARDQTPSRGFTCERARPQRTCGGRRPAARATGTSRGLLPRAGVGAAGAHPVHRDAAVESHGATDCLASPFREFPIGK